MFAKLAEMDMTVADLERANMRVATVERRNVGLSICLECIKMTTSNQELLRAEIESIRTGSEASDRYLTIARPDSRGSTHYIVHSVQTLKNQVASLESETDRLSHLLDMQKDSIAEAEVVRRKAVEHASKELQAKVWVFFY